MSTHQIKNGIVINVYCKCRWFDKYKRELMLDLDKFKYCKPLFEVDIWQKTMAYYRIKIFANKNSTYYFDFCS